MSEPSTPGDDEEKPSGSPKETKERDFGDSAGYGSGGSTLDRHEVGDVPPDEPKKPNPLDAVVKTDKS